MDVMWTDQNWLLRNSNTIFNSEMQTVNPVNVYSTGTASTGWAEVLEASRVVRASNSTWTILPQVSREKDIDFTGGDVLELIQL